MQKTGTVKKMSADRWATALEDRSEGQRVQMMHLIWKMGKYSWPVLSWPHWKSREDTKFWHLWWELGEGELLVHEQAGRRTGGVCLLPSGEGGGKEKRQPADCRLAWLRWAEWGSKKRAVTSRSCCGLQEERGWGGRDGEWQGTCFDLLEGEKTGPGAVPGGVRWRRRIPSTHQLYIYMPPFVVTGQPKQLTTYIYH